MSVTMTAGIPLTDTKVDKATLRVARRRLSSPSHRYRVRVKHFKSRHRYIAFVVDSWTGKTVHTQTLYTVDPRKGRRPARSSEAGREAARIEADWNATGDGNAVVIQTWKEASDTFLAFKKSERRRSTACLYSQYVQRFSDYLGEGHPRVQYLEEITVAVARDYIAWRRQAGGRLSNITLNKDLRHFRHIWQWLVRGGLATKNPWHEIEWLKGTPQQKIWYTAGQGDRLLTAASKLGTKFHAACSVFLDTAVRNGELCHATWQHVDLTTLTITVTVHGPEVRREGGSWFAKWASTAEQR